MRRGWGSPGDCWARPQKPDIKENEKDGETGFSIKLSDLIRAKYLAAEQEAVDED